MTRPHYKVRAYRSGKWWALEAPDVRAGVSQSRRLDQAEPMIREAIALVLDVPEDGFDLTIEPDLDDLNAMLDELHERRQRQEELAEWTGRTQRELADVLVTRYGLAYRDVGSLLGLSHQRVAQILADA